MTTLLRQLFDIAVDGSLVPAKNVYWDGTSLHMKLFGGLDQGPNVAYNETYYTVFNSGYIPNARGCGAGPLNTHPIPYSEGISGFFDPVSVHDSLSAGAYHDVHSTVISPGIVIISPLAFATYPDGQCPLPITGTTATKEIQVVFSSDLFLTRATDAAFPGQIVISVAVTYYNQTNEELQQGATESPWRAGTSYSSKFVMLKSANPVIGCTNPAATNYNAVATNDDGSCLLPTGGGGNPGGGGGTPPAPVYGCTNPAATNYNTAATQDDGTCILPPGGGNPPGTGGGGGNPGGNPPGGGTGLPGIGAGGGGYDDCGCNWIKTPAPRGCGWVKTAAPGGIWTPTRRC